MYPASGPSCGGNTPTAALAYSLYISSVYKYRVLPELYNEQWRELQVEDEAWGEMMLTMVDPPHRRRWCRIYTVTELPFCPWPQRTMARTRRTGQTLATVTQPSLPSVHHMLIFPL